MRKIQLKKITTIFLIVFLLFSSAGITSYKIMYSREFQFFGGIVNRIDTFFLIGSEIEQHPEETKKLISAGQEAVVSD